MMSRAHRAVGLSLGLSALVLAACSGDGTSACDPATVINLTIGSTVNESLDSGHCISEGDPGDLYQFTLAQQTTLRITGTSDKFEPEVSIAKMPASNDTEVAFFPGKPARSYVILPAGQYVLDVQSSDNGLGAYTLSTEVATPTGCPIANNRPGMITATGVTVSASFAPTDCIDFGGAIREMYEVRLLAGHAYTFTLRASVPRLFLDVVQPTGGGSATMVASSGFATNGTATVTYTPTATQYYTIGASPTFNNVNAAYTLQISQ